MLLFQAVMLQLTLQESHQIMTGYFLSGGSKFCFSRGWMISLIMNRDELKIHLPVYKISLLQMCP